MNPSNKKEKRIDISYNIKNTNPKKWAKNLVNWYLEKGVKELSPILEDIELGGVHTHTPWDDFSLEYLIDWSKKNSDNFSIIYDTNNHILEEYYNEYVRKSIFIDEIFSENEDGTYSVTFEDSIYGKTEYPTIEDALNEIFSYLDEVNDIEVESTTSIDYNKLITYIGNLRLIYHFIDKFGFNDNLLNHINNNQVLFLSNRYESDKNGYRYNRRYRELFEVIKYIRDEKYRDIPKSDRPMVFSIDGHTRPTKNNYHKWNGLQVFDLDIKKVEGKKDVLKIKSQLHEELKHHHWYLGIALSTGGSGLHLYTKVERPRHLWLENSHNEEICKWWFQYNYIHKHAQIYWVLKNICKIRVNDEVTDFALSRITTGIAITSDSQMLINENFKSLPIQISFHTGPKSCKDESWIWADEVLSNKRVLDINREWIRYIKKEEKGGNDVLGDIIDGVGTLPSNDSIKKLENLNYTIRYTLSNTIASIWGEEGRELAHHILDSGNGSFEPEIDAFYNTAISSNKEATELGLKLLKKCGVDIDDEKLKELESNDSIDEFISLLNEAIKISNKNIDTNNNINMTSDEYLGTIWNNSIESRLDNTKVNLLESPPGTGKTELVKQLAREGKRVLLVIPFISLIESKILADDEIRENFEIFCDDKSVKVESPDKPLFDLNRSSVMTFDKFSQLDTNEASNFFDYIFIDESHLLFVSKYRLGVMGSTMSKIKEYIGNTNLICMSGTPTGEIVYFNHYNCLNHLKFTKDTNRTKNIHYKIAKDPDQVNIGIAKSIVEKIQNGYKIIFPTNRGDAYAKKQIAIAENLIGRKIVWTYYKKSNSDLIEIDTINKKGTLNDIEVLFCSNYLSVGIDINDIDKFYCIYDDSFMGYEIEQFNCRIRRTDIFSEIWVSMQDKDGEIKNSLFETEGWTAKLSNEEKREIIDFRNYNTSFNRLNLVLEYDPIAKNILSPGLRIENNQIVFKLEEYELAKFEERYTLMNSPYNKIKEMAKYGYKIKISVIEEYREDEIEKVKDWGKEALQLDKMERDIQFNQSLNYLVEGNNTKIKKILFDKELRSNLEIKNRTDEVSIIYDEDGNNIIGLNISNEKIFEESLGYASTLRKYYNEETTMYILESLKAKTGRLPKSEVKRYIDFLKLIEDIEDNKINSNIIDIIQEYINWVIVFDGEFVDDYTHQDMLNKMYQIYTSSLIVNFKSNRVKEKVNNEIERISNILSKKRRMKDGGYKIHIRKLYKPNAEDKLSKFDKMFDQLFGIIDLKLNKAKSLIVGKKDLSWVDRKIEENANRLKNGDISPNELTMEIYQNNMRKDGTISGKFDIVGLIDESENDISEDDKKQFANYLKTQTENRKEYELKVRENLREFDENKIINENINIVPYIEQGKAQLEKDFIGVGTKAIFDYDSIYDRFGSNEAVLSIIDSTTNSPTIEEFIVIPSKNIRFKKDVSLNDYTSLFHELELMLKTNYKVIVTFNNYGIMTSKEMNYNEFIDISKNFEKLSTLDLKVDKGISFSSFSFESVVNTYSKNKIDERNLFDDVE